MDRIATRALLSSLVAPRAHLSLARHCHGIALLVAYCAASLIADQRAWFTLRSRA